MSEAQPEFPEAVSATQSSIHRNVYFSCAVLLFLCFSSLHADRSSVRYLSFADANETLRQYRDSGLPGSSIASAQAWETWVHRQDSKLRSRIDAGVEDSISNLILFGTSFTSLPRIEDSTDALAESGGLSARARLRVESIDAALAGDTANERLQFVRAYLARKGITAKDREAFLGRNLLRYATEQKQYQAKLEKAKSTGDVETVYSVRGTLYDRRGLSVDTSLLPNFALEETLRSLVAKGVLKPDSMRRIAIIGPGLDFADKREGYDFYPVQTIQPFAVMEAVLRAGLAREEDIHVTTLDLNGQVNSHVAGLGERARQGQPYVLQLPRDREKEAEWTPAAASYWEHFGEVMGSEVKPSPVPEALPEVILRAVAIRPSLAARIEPRDLNIVVQTMDLPEGERFDLVVATNILVYYNRFEQSLAMASIARMMNPGGIFLANNALPTAHDHRLKFLGKKSVAFTTVGEYGDDVVVYVRE